MTEYSFDQTDIYIEAPDVRDAPAIVKSLINQCRFNGNVSQYWSVAHHSIFVEQLVKDPNLKKQAIMHDFPEAIIGDIITPIKHASPKVLEVEKQVTKMFEDAYNIKLSPLPNLVKLADECAYYREVMCLKQGGNDSLIYKILGMSPDEIKHYILGWVK